MAKIGDIDVNVKLSVSDDTAQVCLDLVKLYCLNRLDGYDPGDEVCHGCALLKGVYCAYKNQAVCTKSK